jgi:hypothetical protein
MKECGIMPEEAFPDIPARWKWDDDLDNSPLPELEAA